MRLIRQRNEWDCGLSVAAMLAGCSRARAVDHDPCPDAERGLSTAEMLGLLRELTGDDWFFRDVRRPLVSVCLPFVPAALVIRREADKYGHWIAWQPAGRGLSVGSFLDPDFDGGKFERRDFPKMKWGLIRVVTRTNPHPTLPLPP